MNEDELKLNQQRGQKPSETETEPSLETQSKKSQSRTNKFRAVFCCCCWARRNASRGESPALGKEEKEAVDSAVDMALKASLTEYPDDLII